MPFVIWTGKKKHKMKFEKKREERNAQKSTKLEDKMRESALKLKLVGPDQETKD